MGQVTSLPTITSSTTQPITINTVQAQALKNKQDILIQNLQTAITNINNSVIVDASSNATQPTRTLVTPLPTVPPITTTNPNTTTTSTVAALAEGFRNIGNNPVIEGFTNLYLPNNKIFEVKDYVNAYNESVALLDDPANLNEINFQTYLHIQDQKINEVNKLIKDITDLQKDAKQSSQPIKAIRNLNTSTILNVEEYPDPKITAPNGTTYYANGSSKYPNYLIYGNNGCLQYNKGTDNTNPSTYNFQPCNSNNSNQRFTIKRIANKDDYNNSIFKDAKNDYSILSDDSIGMGFYIVNPETDEQQCMQLNNDGLSVRPCDLYAPQRFKPYYHSVNP